MWTPDSRYVNAITYTVTRANGDRVIAVRIPPALRAPVVGYYPRPASERLDLVAVRFLNAPTGFWRLCDANNAMLASALEARALIGIPQGPMP